MKITKEKIKPIILFLGFAAIIIFIWFRNGLAYGGGDVGLPTDNPKRVFEIVRFIWWESAAPGFPIPSGLTSVPLMLILSFFQSLGFSPVVLQAMLFYILLFLMGYGMFLVGRSVFGNQKIGLAILTGLFYMFNPYMMIQVWHRFVHTTLFLAAALPFIFLFWRSWIKKGDYWSLFLFLLTNFLAAYLYGTLAFIATILIILVFIFLFEALFPWNGFYTLRIISLRLIIGFVFWILINSWWMPAVFNVAPTIFFVQHTVGDSLTTLLGISQQAIIPYSLLGINPFYIYEQLDWGKIYEFPFFRFLPWLSLLFLVPGFIKSLTKKGLLIWSILLSVGLFLAKGAAAPFGYIYIFGFSNFFTLGVLRNPYEKLGILIPFSMSVLLAIGISWYLETVKYKFKIFLKVGIGFLLVILLGVNLWPMWLGKMFGKYDNPAFIDVPTSYTSADDFIKRQNKEGRILHLPLTSGESATYDWKFGYNGIEPSQLLFKSLPSISHGFHLNYTDDALIALSSIFTLSPVEEKKIINLLQIFNVRFIILHKDMEWRGGYLFDPQKLETILNSLNFLTKKADFDKLVVYELKDEFFRSKIGFSKDINYLVPNEESTYWPWLLKDNTGDLITPIGKENFNQLINLSNQLVILPENLYSYSPQSIAKENVINELAATRFLTDSPLYQLVKLKEKILLFTMPITDKFIYRITLAGKRLVEAYRIKDKKLNVPIRPILLAYQDFLPSLKEAIIARKGTELAGGEISLESIFSRHIAVLDELLTRANQSEKEEIVNTKNKLISMLKESNLMPSYQIKENKDLPVGNRLVARFNISHRDKYELLQAHQNVQNVYKDRLSKSAFQIDNRIVNLPSAVKGDFLSYGLIELDEGIHEISFYTMLSNDLYNFPSDLKKIGNVDISGEEVAVTSGEHDPSYIEFDIKSLTGGGWYQLTFESWIKLGDKYIVRLIQDTDPADPSGEQERLYAFNKLFYREPYYNYWNTYTFNLHLRPATTQARIRLLVEPWDDCRIILVQKILCKNKQIRFPFEHPSTVVFKNIQLSRQLRNPVFLRRNENPTRLTTNLSGGVSFTKHNPISYSGQINIDQPVFLVFSESFHSGWELYLNDGKKDYKLSPQFIANLFTNAWYLENKGGYTFRLEFTPQRLVKYGIITSIIGWLSILTLMFWKRFRR